MESRKRAPGALRLRGSSGGHRGAPGPTNRRALPHQEGIDLFADDPRSLNEPPQPPTFHLRAGRPRAGVKLTRDDQKVVIADRAPPPKSLMAELGERASWVNLDFGGADWDSLLRGAGVVHHYAWGSVPGTANDPSEDFTTNVQPTLRLLEALRQVAVRREAPSLIFPSSGGTVYGKVRNVPTREDHPLAPINVYGAGKASAELYLGVYRAIHGLDCRVARLSNPFGAGQDLSRGQGAATTFVYQALSDQPIHIWGDGEVVRDYIHVSDAAAGLVALACAPRNDRCWIFNMGSGE